jgi:hypothetical protein
MATDLLSVAIGAALALAVIAAATFAGRRERRAGFASRRAAALHGAARDLFGAAPEGGATFTELRRRVGGDVDAVTFADLRELWRQGRLTPEEVERALED